MEYQFYEVVKKPPLAWVYLNRPAKKNAMNLPAWTETIPIFEELSNADEIRCIILSGRGSCFSVGIDLLGMAEFMSELMDKEQKGGIKWKMIKKIKQLQDSLTCIELCRKPVIAAIHGYCIGGGLDMAAACDIRLSSCESIFSLRETAVGFVADVGVLQRLPRIVGQGITRELAYTAKNFDATRAREILLVNAVYQTQQELWDGAEKMALEIAQNSPLGVQATKNVLNFGMDKSNQDGLDFVASVSTNIIPSDELTEAMTAFMEKRKPIF